MTVDLKQKEYLTTNDLVDFFGVTRQAIGYFRELKRDPLPFYRVRMQLKDGSESNRSIIRFSYWDVKAWIERKKVKQHDPDTLK